jgi:hypothetical protein
MVKYYEQLMKIESDDILCQSSLNLFLSTRNDFLKLHLNHELKTLKVFNRVSCTSRYHLNFIISEQAAKEENLEKPRREKLSSDAQRVIECRLTRLGRILRR